jgi:hypothetical protein
VRYTGERRGTLWQAFREKHAGNEVLTPAEWESVRGMAEAIREFDAFPIDAMIKAGSSEKSIFFSDESGVKCKIRCDSVSPHLIIDLKTTDDARPGAFLRQAMKLEYDLQAAMYQEGCRQFYGRSLPFYFVVVETQAPFGVMVHRAGDTLLEAGFQKWKKALAVYQHCAEQDSWPSYHSALSVLEIPHWAAYEREGV